MKPEEASASGKRYRDDVVDGRAKNVNLYLISILLFFFFFVLYDILFRQSSVLCIN